MSLFSKELPCENCGNIVPRKQICDYYYSRQEKPNSKRKRLCMQCAMDSFYRSLIEAKAKAVVIRPEEKYNAVIYYEFNRINALDDNEEFSSCMKNALPKDGQACQECGEEAFYTWCSLDIICNDILNWEPFTDDFERTYLCKECLVKAMKQKLEEDNIRLSAIGPAYGGEGFYSPWQV